MTIQSISVQPALKCQYDLACSFSERLVHCLQCCCILACTNTLTML